MRTPYQDIYLIDTETDITTVGTFANVGLDVAKYNMLPTNKPGLLTNKTINDVQKCTGLSERVTGAGQEFTMLQEEPSISGLAVEMDNNNLGLFAYLLIQSGMSQAVDPFAKTVIPYVDSDCEIFASIGRLLSASTESRQIDGCVISSLTIAGTSGGVITMSADFIGRAFSNSVDLSAVATTVVGTVPILHSGLTVTLGGDAIDLESFEITIGQPMFSSVKP